MFVFWVIWRRVVGVYIIGVVEQRVHGGEQVGSMRDLLFHVGFGFGFIHSIFSFVWCDIFLLSAKEEMLWLLQMSRVKHL